MNAADFREWRARMGFAGRGGQRRTAEALGLSTSMVRIYDNGMYPGGRPVNYPLALRLAMSALAMGLPPWPPKM